MRGVIMAVVMLAIGAVGGVAVVSYGQHAKPPADARPGATDAPSDAADVNTLREPQIHLDIDGQRRIGLQTALLGAYDQQPTVTAFGLLQEDPEQSFVVRAPIAGSLESNGDAVWPTIHAQLPSGALIAYVKPRLTPMEQVDLSTRQTEARAQVAEAQAALDAARSSFEHKRALSTETKSVSDRALEEADAAVRTQEAHLAAAQRIVELIEGIHAETTGPAGVELRVARSGEVVELLARPGESVEPGQPLLRLSAFDSLLARVELPIGASFDESSTTSIVFTLDDDGPALGGKRIGIGSNNDGLSHGATLLLRVPVAGRSLRPGMAVIAHIPAPGGKRAGVIIPRAAVIRLFGQLGVFVEDSENTFVRRALTNAKPTDAGWFAAGEFQAGDRVVIVGAQALLSEELKSQIEREEAATE